MTSDDDDLREVDERLAKLLAHDTTDETAERATGLKMNQLIIRTLKGMRARIERLEARVRELEAGG